jgi:hypothetical protein
MVDRLVVVTTSPWDGPRSSSTHSMAKALSPELQQQITELMGRRAETEHQEKEAALTPAQLRVLLAQPECRKTVITEVLTINNTLNYCLLLILVIYFCYDLLN